MSSVLRFKAVETAFERAPISVKTPKVLPSEFFCEKVFTNKVMQRYLSSNAYEQLQQNVDEGIQIDSSLADEIAMGMKSWALDNGATHYTHWFQPLTGGTAEKHDAFINPDGKGGVIETFNGKLLIQQEPDASSFPSGGLRNTFEARGYSAWDPSSPAFIIDDTLCIPTIFISYTGDALDYKTPLLRSQIAVSKAAEKITKYFLPETKKIKVYLGWEQEFFLVDESLYNARPDLVATGRTLMGHASAKEQQLEDHYFGAIPERVVNFMKEFEIEAYRLGIPIKTRHNEVAPNQFEFAPIYEECSLAVDNNLLCMILMKKIARKHRFRVLLHEKPYKGVNGSGKHCNWSLGTDTGQNLFSPGKNQIENLLFVAFMANVLQAVKDNNGLLKASISTASNAYRLGAAEAPPAIISVFLGTQVSDILDRFEKEDSKTAIHIDTKKRLKLGIGQLPEIFQDNTDRNRTSPFAFTGNRFEFRATGSSDNCSAAMIAINTAVANQLLKFNESIEAMLKDGASITDAFYAQIKKLIVDSKSIRFEGNGYSEEWKKEAKKRGLDVETSVPIIYDFYTDKKSIDAFEKTGVLNKVELLSRNEVHWELYIKKIQIESRVLGDLTLNHIVPVAIRYQSQILKSIELMKQIYSEDKFQKYSTELINLNEKISYHVETISSKVNEMINARKKANVIESYRERAIAYHDIILPFMDQIRYSIDKLEFIVDDEMWPLPKYRELLFIN